MGSYAGKSTIWIASGSEHGNKVRVYSIDSHKSYGFKGFMGTIRKAGFGRMNARKPTGYGKTNT